MSAAFLRRVLSPCLAALCACVTFVPLGCAGAQEPVDLHTWSVSGGTFLTRDRGWNYELGLELGVGIARRMGSRLQLSAGAALLTGLGTAFQGREAIFPPYPEGLRHALALRLEGRTRTAGPGIYALGGVEALTGTAGVSGSGVRAGASAGLGLTWRRRARSALEGQYVVFDRALGTTRGVLAVRYVRLH